VIIVVSNRKVNPDRTDEQLFGEQPNQQSLDELRLAIATYDPDRRRWTLELQPEPNPIDPDNPPSRQLFNQVIQKIEAGELREDWVLYIHGFNQSFRESLQTSWELQQRYQVNILAFSWPSNPAAGFDVQEYRDARQAAQLSNYALDRTLEKLGNYLAERSDRLTRQRYQLERTVSDDLPADTTSAQCRIRLSLMAHSLGNFLVESFIRTAIFNGETRIFENVILHQADVDSRTHVDWVDRIDSRRVYVTLNERDNILKASDVVNPPRLGNTI
jgi:esterase/lipase superfamily enzyme